ncbi:MAG: thioredoxin [Mycoplasmataceae bacterium]|nr:thioredoxin [Mycoplasmataceae bacterium]
MSVQQVVSLKDLKEITSNGYTLVDFYATWCGPCKMLSPIIDELSNTMSDIQFVKIDVDQASDAAQAFSIRSIPTVYLFKDGKTLSFFNGYLPKEQVIDFINKQKR